jgi:hypothetical protein
MEYLSYHVNIFVMPRTPETLQCYNLAAPHRQDSLLQDRCDPQKISITTRLFGESWVPFILNLQLNGGYPLILQSQGNLSTNTLVLSHFKTFETRRTKLQG